RLSFNVGVFSQDGIGDLEDVLTGISTFGDLFTVHPRPYRGRENIQLRAIIIDVILVGDFRARGTEKSTNRIAEGSPPGVTDMQGTVCTSLDKLHIYEVACSLVIVAEYVTGFHDGACQLASCRSVKNNVDETRASDLDFGNAVQCLQFRRQYFCELPWVHAGTFTKLHSNIGRPVTVIARLWSV